MHRQVHMFPIGKLKIHPFHHEIYGDLPNEQLYETIFEDGVQVPLIVTADGAILDGVLRYYTCLNKEIALVPTILWDAPSDMQERAILRLNRQRKKTSVQIARECRAYLKIESAGASKRKGLRTDRRSGVTSNRTTLASITTSGFADESIADSGNITSNPERDLTE